MPTKPGPGEVWFAELGMAEKSRPVLVLAFPGREDARALTVVAPLTSQIRHHQIPQKSAGGIAPPARHEWVRSRYYFAQSQWSVKRVET